ncbi:origin recognition complex subunit 2-like [Xenia sp. Carnegie-2017]|uniref:origin recognition complex subunit 2-like n=1 Tax=Xenia sp. Carnegie-2017 TaxID=2897299 RepID=UPI001F0381D7|nr:origin recognition complex subunit 2-like [Xenia sp. Carnegie-2017]
MANSIEKDMPIVFIDDDDVKQCFTPRRTGLRSARKELKSLELVDDRASLYYETVALDSSSDDEIEFMHVSGKAVLSCTPISSHNVFSFQKTKRKTALATAASAAQHTKTPKTRIRGENTRKSNGSSDESSHLESDNDDEMEELRKNVATTMNNRSDKKNNMEGMLDEYFLAHDERDCLTSDRTLSSLPTPRMDPETLSSVLKFRIGDHQNERLRLFNEYKTYFPKWMFQLRNGFNLLLYGLGSKRTVIDQFREKMLSQRMQMVVNGFFPSVTIKSILNTITNDVLEHDETFKNLVEHCAFITDYFEQNKDEELYLTIHNIDGTMLRSSSTQTIISLLAQCSSIFVIASIDHIHAPLIWDQSQMGRFNWLWYDVTTFEPYTEETSYENSLLVQQSGSMGLSSLIHVFQSLTANAKGIFLLIGNYQLERSNEVNYVGMSFSDCYTKCREAFLVNSDAALRAQLTEFKDHKLMRLKKGTDGVDYLLILLDVIILKKFIEEHKDLV